MIYPSFLAVLPSGGAASWRLQRRMIDKELVKQRIDDLELSIPSLEKEIKELRKKLKEEKRQLRDAKILFWQAGGK